MYIVCNQEVRNRTFQVYSVYCMNLNTSCPHVDRISGKDYMNDIQLIKFS